MSMKISEAYRTLGLEAGATPQEIKKAYSRMVHQFSPEKEPEQFRKVREAYETVKDAPKAEENAFSDLERELSAIPEAAVLMERISKHHEREEWAAAAANLEQLIELAPGHAELYRLLGNHQMMAGNHQKAAANAEKAIQLAPDDIRSHMLLANALWDRGWTKKAFAAFIKAYELGGWNKSFLLKYAMVMEKMKERGRADAAEAELFADQRCDDEDEFFGYQNLYCAMLENRSLFAEDVDGILDHYDAWVKANRQGYDGWEILYPLRFFIKKRRGLMRDRRIVTRVERSAKDAHKVGAAEEDDLYNLRCSLQEEAIPMDDRLRSKRWEKLALLLRFNPQNGSGTVEYLAFDQILCMMKGEAEALRKDLPVIKSSYPILYDTFGKILDEAVQYPADVYNYLKEQYDQMSRTVLNSEVGEFYNLYPEEQRKGKRRTADTDDKDDFEDVYLDSPEDPYVREKEKVGRNDPCPCGSGKKFKKCCMGKGIYD